MKHTYRHATGGLIALVGVGCASGASTHPAAEPVPVEKVEQSIQQSFDRLNALHVVTSARLVLDLPAEATACYNLPCPGSEWEAKYHAERARQAPRLERLVGLAENAALADYGAMRDMSEAAAAVQALNGLAVIEVAGLVEVQPVNNGNCYGACPADIAAADRVNRAHVTQVFAIVDAAQKSGL
jgi:hypothetical protein